jgi:diguanylate cyclase (GGDEF)-like protein
MDVDNFETINVERGHEVGDVILSGIANRLLNITRASDLVARYGGDEFAIVLPNTDVAGAKVLAEKVRLEIQQMEFEKGAARKGVHVSVSIGCSQFNMEDLNPETILSDAKIALQRAKKAGRNCVRVQAAR